MSRIFVNPLTELIEYEELNRQLEDGRGPVQVSGCMDSQKVHLIQETVPAASWKLVVTYDDSRAREIYEDFGCFRQDVWLYPAKDLLFYSADIHGNLITRQRLQVLRHLMEDSTGIVVTTLDGLMDHLLPLCQLKSQIMKVTTGQELDLNQWKESLVRMGYERTGQVDGMGQFSVRGGILDIFPLTEEQPIRIELWDTEVDSIRTFDLESQRSIEQLEETEIYPASELVLTEDQRREGAERIRKEARASVEKLRSQMLTEEAHRLQGIAQELVEGIEEGVKVAGLDACLSYFSEETVSFLDYFKENNSMIVLDEPARLREKGEAVELEFRESMSHRLEKGYLLPGQTNLLYTVKELLAQAQRGNTLYLTGLEQKLPGLTVNGQYRLNVKNVNTYQNSFELLIKDLQRWKREKYRVILLSGSRTRASRLAGDLREYELSAFCPDSEERQVQPGEILVVYGNLHRGFEYPQIKFVVITEGDMFGTEKKKRKRKKGSYEGQKIQSFSELSVGDYVVHEDHGLGIYRGIEKIERDKVIKDYLKIEYADGGNLYLPATRLDGTQK